MNGKRMHAAVFDIFIMSIILMFLFIGFIMFPLMLQSINPDKCLSLFYLLSTYAFIYMIIRDNLGKRSIGKRNLGLTIINKDTRQQANGLSRLIRNITLIIWPIDLIVLFTTGSRIGDKIAGTEVIVKSENTFKTNRVY